MTPSLKFLSLVAPFLLLAQNVSATPSWNNLASRQDEEKPFFLRIMPLGASITAGYGTDPQNGYRKDLRDLLTGRGWPVNMVGSLEDGDFDDNQHEGHSGYVVDQMIGVSDLSIDQQPNVVLINCGTNDADPSNDQDIPATPDRMRDVLNHLYDNISNVTIVLSTLVPRLDDNDENVQTINDGYRDLVDELAGAGSKLLLAEFNNGLLDTSTEYFDDVHPNEEGQAKLAGVWDDVLAQAEDNQFLTAPNDTGVPDE